MNIYTETQEILKKYKIQANKSLGQNFLISDNVVNTIIEEANIQDRDLIIEIGPGLGVLTNKILEKTKNVIAVELDKRMVEILKDRFLNSNLKIINEDILKVDLTKIIREYKINQDINNVKIVANLPYYISTPIITKLLASRLEIDEIIVMVQKEVADRIVSKTGTRNAGAITYFVDYYSEAKPIIKVGKESFIPSPKVESEVISLKVRKSPKINVLNEEMLFNVIQKAFLQRRKTLENALVNYNILKNKEEVEKMFITLNIDSKIRGEKLTLEQFGEIANYLTKTL